MIEEGMNLEKLRGPARKSLRAGDVFAYRLKGVDYGSGRVIRTDVPLCGPANLLYFYRVFSNTKRDVSVFGARTLLIPPIITGRELWNSGHFETVGHVPLKEREILAVHCFKDLLGRGYFDEYGKRLPKRVRPTGVYAYECEAAIDDQLSEARGIPPVRRLDPLTRARHYEAERRAARGKPRRRAEVVVRVAADFPLREFSEAVYELEDHLESAVRRDKVGRCDGHGIELDRSSAEIFFTGKDADGLLRVLVPALKREVLGRDSHLLARYMDGTERRVEI